MADALPVAPGQAGDLRTRLEAERAKLERELAEIGMLMQQATTEAERYENRRQQAAERLEALEHQGDAGPDALREAHAHLLTQTRRASLMQAQTEVLQGKQRGLERLSSLVADVLGSLDMSSAPVAQAPGGRQRSRGRPFARSARRAGGDAPRDRPADARRTSAEHREHSPAGRGGAAPVRARPGPGRVRARPTGGHGPARPRGDQDFHLRRAAHGAR